MLNNIDAVIAGAIGELIDLAEMGGPVMILLFATSLLLWATALERCIFFAYKLPKHKRAILSHWWVRSDIHSWNAQAIRTRLLSVSKIRVTKGFALIRFVSLIAPLLGLLGTVTGMISVFDVLAISGAENARAMAAGVSRATIPTMAGMVVSLTALFLLHSFHSKSNKILLTIDKQLSHASER